MRIVQWIALAVGLSVIGVAIAFGNSPRATVDRLNLVLGPVVVILLGVSFHSLYRFRRACVEWQQGQDPSREAAVSEDHAGFIIDIKRPTRDADRYVACLVITPKRRDGVTDVGAKVERNLGRVKAVQLSVELLAACGAPESVLAQVRALSPEASGPGVE